ncbi:MAG: hypothetical protein J3K34DRAFT_516733 [Monoraphidium minutum]|nr:MAG: hypothetical protein J3K34DRAFT_516733 [Monoraphidium minutum]
MEVAPDDPLRDLKLRLLSELGAGAGRGADLAGLPIETCLAAARALVLRTDEAGAWAPSAADLRAPGAAVSARNEAAALALLHAHAGQVCGGGGGEAAAARRRALQELSAGYCARTGAPGAALPPPAGGEGRGILAAAAAGAAADAGAPGRGAALPEGDPAAALAAWAAARGVEASLTPAVFPGGLRGLMAVAAAATAEDGAGTVREAAPGGGRGDTSLAAGEVALSLPAGLLITYETAAASDFGRALARIPGLDEEAAALIWTMVERHDPEAEAAPFWAALPPRFCTGLSAPQELVDLLEGSPLHAKFSCARAHLAASFSALAPVFEALLAAYGQHLRREWFGWGAFCWAAELWYAYAIQVRFPGGATRPALAPFLSLLNHSPWPHVVRFSEVDGATGRLRLPLLRPAGAGEEVFLSYGPLPNADLLLFYGFVIPGNPADVIAVPLDPGDDGAPPPGADGRGAAAAPAARALQRRRREALAECGLCAEVVLRPAWRRRQLARLLPAARVLVATEAELSAAGLGAAAAVAAAAGGRGRGGKGDGAVRQQQQREQKRPQPGAWPAQPGGAENEAAAAALLEAAAARVRAPLEAALRRARAAAAAPGLVGAPGAQDSGSGGGSGGGGAAGGTEEACFSTEERRAFLGHLESLLSGAAQLLAPGDGAV